MVTEHTIPHGGKLMQADGPADGEGSTTCTCGAESPSLPSAAARRRWHADHAPAKKAASAKPKAAVKRSAKPAAKPAAKDAQTEAQTATDVPAPAIGDQDGTVPS